MIKEIPILFSTPMVQAILRDSEPKTQTRRTKSLNDIVIDDNSGYVYFNKHKVQLDIHTWKQDILKHCPYGLVGDLLWVRETWAVTSNIESLDPWPNRPHIMVNDGTDGSYKSACIYLADGEWQWLDADGCETDKSYWKPSIHMPKKAARIWLEVVSVRVEQLQDITEEDAKAEGVLLMQKDGAGSAYKDYTGKMLCLTSARESFESLWKSINNDLEKPQTHWDANPWVWVVEFKKVDKQ